ncbi:hypothetical protein [Streptomyces sp. NPDC047071]|uniref:hypothetical protein n=1 Tax=Streptomyces sp. NPDC047071 TaxID=3154808 RepID=UPI00345676DB
MEAYGNKWPYARVRGQGLVEQPAAPGDMSLLTWLHRYVDDLKAPKGAAQERLHSEYVR